MVYERADEERDDRTVCRPTKLRGPRASSLVVQKVGEVPHPHRFRQSPPPALAHWILLQILVLPFRCARGRAVSAPSILRNFGAPARSSQAGCVRRCLRILLRHPTLARPPLSHPMIERVPSLFPCYASLFAPHDQFRHTYHARNAADLCRYYRRQSRNPLRPHIRYIELASTSTRQDGRRCCLSAAEISARPMAQRDIVHAQLHPCSSCTPCACSRSARTFRTFFGGYVESRNASSPFRTARKAAARLD